MTPTAEAPFSIPPVILEAVFTAIICLTVLGWPALGSVTFARIERFFVPLARRRGLAVLTVGLSGLLLRLAILPFCPVPLPFVPDDFSFLLAADTFAHGRLTNPTPALWTHFESIHISMLPTYQSMYFPAQGLMLALGKVLFGHPWAGQLIASALMCAALCWMLQAWMPATWAFLGGMIAVVHLGLFSYWINTYHAGALMALGGALVLGALPRLLKTARFRYGLLMAIGMSILALSRPYEGMLLCLPVVFVLGRWALFGKNQPSKSVLMRRAALPVLLVVAAVAWLGYYDYRAFGSPTTLPYTVNRAAYAMAPYYVWQSPRPEPVYRHAVMRGFYYLGEFRYFQEIHKPTGFLIQTIIKIVVGITFFSSIALLPPLIMIRRVFVDRRMRILVACLAVLIVGMGIEIFLLPHYLAPFTALFYALGLQAMRHLRLLKVEGKPVGITLVRLCVSITLGMACLRLYAGPLHLALPEQPTGAWNCIWYGPDHFGTERANVAAQLAQLPGNQLAIVRYSAKHHPMSEWVYNSYDIDNAKVIWAREMNETDNRKLLDYYKGRTVWLVQPDSLSSQVTPYPVPGHQEDVTQ